jgi:hypothetical protein
MPLRLRHLDQRGFPGHRDGFRHVRERKLEIERDRRIDCQRHAISDRRLESGQLRLDVVDAGIETRNEEITLGVGDAGSHHAGARIGRRDGHPWQNGVTLIEGPPVERARALRKRHPGAHQQQAQNER